MQKSKIVNIGNTKFKVITLTEPLRENSELYPGDPNIEKEIFCTFEKQGCQYNIYRIGDHVFHPHGDAPRHHNPEYDERGFEFWDINYAFNQACLIDLSNSKDAKIVDGIKIQTEIKADNITSNLEKLRNSEAVIFRTGYDKWIEANNVHVPEFIPYFNKEAASLLAKLKNIKVIGTDSLTVDKFGVNHSHKLFKDKFIVECLVNLYAIPKNKRDNFTLQTSPIAIEGATGGPVVAYAYIQLD